MVNVDKGKEVSKMTIGTFTKMLGLATEFADMWGKSETGLVGVSVSCLKKQPELHLTSEAFDELVAKLQPAIDHKNNEPLIPCFMFMGVCVFCLLTEKEAAERGYLTEAEAAFYGK